MTSDANGVYRGVYTYGEERISVRDLVEVEGVPNDPLYYMYDGRGSVTQLTNAVGNVRDKYRYTPFGEPMSGGKLSPNTKLLNNPYGYNGEYHDLESGFQYLRARYYNPETARFITRDSYLGEINEPLSLNRYAYTLNNPVKYKDPSGNGPQYAGDDIVQQNQIDEAYLRGELNSSVGNQPLIEWGSRGDAVVKIQKILDEQGYYLGPSGVDGVYGKHTYNAVKAYQTKNGLQVDGKVGPETWGSFNSYINSKAAESRGRSNNSNACDDLGGGVVSGKGAQKTGNAEPILGSDNYNRNILQIAAGSKENARRAFNQIMSDVDKYGDQLDDFGSDNVARFNELVSSTVIQIGDVDKEMHFFRNKLNRGPETLDDMISYISNNPDKKWTMLDIDQAAFHMNGEDGIYNLKFVSYDGHFERVYNSITGELVTDSINMGTYNYVGPSDKKSHTKYDVNPYFESGNTEEQGINRSLLKGSIEELDNATSNLARYLKGENENARMQHDYYWHLLYGWPK